MAYVFVVVVVSFYPPKMRNQPIKFCGFDVLTLAVASNYMTSARYKIKKKIKKKRNGHQPNKYLIYIEENVHARASRQIFADRSINFSTHCNWDFSCSSNQFLRQFQSAG